MPPGITTLAYTLYRLALASLMTAGIIAHIIDFSGNNPGYKWLIYMTNQVNLGGMCPTELRCYAFREYCC